jgi:site-specific recombinase XerD
VRSLAGWLAEHHPEVGPAELERQHIRGWLVEVRERHSRNTARGWFAGVRHFCRWLQSEGEADQDATAGVKTPAPGDPQTPVLSDADLRTLLATRAGRDFTARRDTAIIMLFLDGGLRLSELADLQVADVDCGTGSCSWPVRPAGAAAPDTGRSRSESRRPARWIATSASDAGITDLHPHAFRHTWAHAFRAAGGNEGDLMLLGGWRNRAMLDRYGKADAADRAADASRRLSLGDRI